MRFFLCLLIATAAAQPPGLKEAILKHRGSHEVLISSDSFSGSLPIRAGLEAGFKRIHAIDIHVPEHTASILRYYGLPHISLYHHDSAPLLLAIMASLEEPALIWLDAFWRDELKIDGRPVPDKFSVLRELASIEKHPIKTHTLLIGDADLLPLEEVQRAVLRINPAYRLSFEDEGRILVVIPHLVKKVSFNRVGQPRPLRPVCIAKLFKFSCFDAGCAWLKGRAPPCQFLTFLTKRGINEIVVFLPFSDASFR